MAPLEAAFFWIAVGLYGITTALYIYAFIFKNEKVLSEINYFVGVSFVIHTAAILARWYAVGNLPVAGDYENALGGVWVIMLFYLYASIRYKSLRAIGVAVLPFSLLLLGYGAVRVTELAPMVAAVRSFWLYIHVIFAWLAFSAFTVCFGLGIIYILKEKNPEKEFYNKFPELPRLDELMFRYLVFGFITDAVMIASGAIWAKNLWGHYWGWDPVETWSLITWLIYGLAIHLRITMGWRGRRFAWILIFAIIGMVITYFGINLVVKTSLHIFDAWKEI
jgi:cytochrome c-type biogenesis protein CcsB